MSGRDEMFRRAYPYNLEMVELAGRSCKFYITQRMLGMVADSVAYPLYQHLRPRIALPPWWQLLHAPRTIPGTRFVRHREVVGLAQYATLIPLDGAQLEVYRITPTNACTLYTFDLDYMVGMKLLRGLPWAVLRDLSHRYRPRPAAAANDHYRVPAWHRAYAEELGGCDMLANAGGVAMRWHDLLICCIINRINKSC